LKEDKAAELGLSVEAAGFILRTMVDGAVIGDFWDKGDKIDLKLLSSAGSVKYVEDLDALPVAVRASGLVPLSYFVEKQMVESPTQINHIEERRAVRLIVMPPHGMELETAMKKLTEEIIKPMRENKLVPPDVDIMLAGTADKLTATREALKWNFILALMITYLLMASLFESFLYPFVIMFSVPLASVGGFMGFYLVHKFTGQQLDILTMLGFILLIGTVVKNAILIVHQALNYMRDHGMGHDDAIVESVKTRIRPIFMSTLTTVFGMLPLVLFPGAGSELYRGLGSVVIGGLVVSTIFTLFVVPSLFSLVLSFRKKTVEV
jgi:HAE1 family hydrophobic/amphiphilic exporter-1